MGQNSSTVSVWFKNVLTSYLTVTPFVDCFPINDADAHNDFAWGKNLRILPFSWRVYFPCRSLNPHVWCTFNYCTVSIFSYWQCEWNRVICLLEHPRQACFWTGQVNKQWAFSKFKDYANKEKSKQVFIFQHRYFFSSTSQRNYLIPSGSLWRQWCSGRVVDPW